VSGDRTVLTSAVAEIRMSVADWQDWQPSRRFSTSRSRVGTDERILTCGDARRYAARLACGALSGARGARVSVGRRDHSSPVRL